MKSILNLSSLLIYIFIFANNLFYSPSSFSKQKSEINLDNELVKGNLLIGLKQHIGSNPKQILKNYSLNFKSSSNFLTLKSFNGIEHKSKEIKIIWKKIPLNKPLIVRRNIMGPFSSFESAKRQASLSESKGYEPVIAFPKNWELWLQNDNKLPKESGFRLQEIKFDYEIKPFLITEYSSYRLDGPIAINSNQNITINEINYGKTFYLVNDSYGTWTLIQKISFADYLKGVVPHEIGSKSPLEALKAQAIISRTWAIYNSDRFKIDNYHLCITTQCQVYKPTVNSNKTINEAIMNTSGKILTYKNKPINAFFHATNGGIIANASESWNIEDYPYLSSKIDSNIPKIKEKRFRLNERSNLEIFLNRNVKELLGKNHYLFRWKKKLLAEQILNYLVKSNLVKNNDRILNLMVKERGESGRVTKLAIITKDLMKPLILSKDEIRRYLSFLPSNLFIINKLNDNLWLFKGGGFGHGVGLSQAGAIEMAKLGFPYQKILFHYYQRAEIMNMKNLEE